MMTVFERALNIALHAHAGQTDKGGHPYILHPLAVAATFQTDFIRAVAVLHDVLEDTSVTERDLLFMHDMPPAVVNAVVALTRLPDESYMTYLRRVKKNAMARAVKIADINHNLTRDRVADPAIRAILEKNRPQYYKGLAMLDHREE